MEMRDAQFGDIRAVQRVAQTTWDHTYRDSIPERVREEFVSQAYSAHSLQKRMGSDVFLVALQDENIVGFADFRPLSRTEVELAAIYVLPEMQAQGTGSRLLAAGVERFPSNTTFVLRVEQETRPLDASTKPTGFGGLTSLRKSSSVTSFTTSRWSSTLDLSPRRAASRPQDRRFLQQLATVW